LGNPIPRQEVFDTYWKFAAERQLIFYRRLLGHRKPWTKDKILQDYKFCNSFRASDRTSQFLLKRVIYNKELSQEPEDIIFRLLLFRFFNKPETWLLLENLYGDPKISNFDVQRWYRDMDNGDGLFSGAYMLCGVKTFGFDKKHGNYLALVKHMMDDGIIPRILNAETLEDVYKSLYGYPLVGKFHAYQITTDMNYSPVVNFEENSFTMAGPGAERGIQKCFSSVDGLSCEETIHWMRDHQEENFLRLGYSTEHVWLWGRPLQNIDIQNVFCETDKYCRVAFPDLDAGGKTRIKSSFKPLPSHMRKEELFYPPKWGINSKLEKLPDVPPAENSEDDEDLPWKMTW